MTIPGEDLLLGGVCALLAIVLALRIVRAFRTGVIPLYRTRLNRAEAGEGKFFALVAINAALMLLLAGIAADLLLGLGLR
jgi:hypothetical protein